MKIKEITIKEKHKIRFSQQRDTANYGAGVYLVRSLSLVTKKNRNMWRKMWEKSFLDYEEANNYFLSEIKYYENIKT